MAKNPLDEVHAKAYEERQKAPVMNDPTVATPGTYDEVIGDVREGLEAELDARFSPAHIRAESSEDSAWNPNSTQPTIDESGNEQDPVGGPAGEDIDTSEEGDEADVDAVDSAYDPVRTTNDIRVDAPEGEDVDTTSPTPDEDVDFMLEDWDPEAADEGLTVDSSVDNADQVDDALGNKSFSEADAEGDDDLDGLTKAELLDRATDAGVEGRSSMNKEELKDALRSA